MVLLEIITHELNYFPAWLGKFELFLLCNGLCDLGIPLRGIEQKTFLVGFKLPAIHFKRHAVISQR